MKDLLVYTADADALALMRALLARPDALQIRAITFDIERHPQRDAGMVQSGPELARIQKGRYHKALLIWDHHGSGRDHKQAPTEVEQDVQARLDGVTWLGNSGVAVLVPELEQWLWFGEGALARHCGVALAQLNVWAEERADKLARPVAELKAKQPKELFEHIMRDRLKRTISPRDFEEIGKLISVRRLLACNSFSSVLTTLRRWFPP